MKRRDIPLLLDGSRRHETVNQLGERAATQIGHEFTDRFRLQYLIALRVEHLALIVRDVVVFQQLLAHVEVAALNLALRRLDRARDHPGLDRLAFGELQSLHDGTHAVAGEDSHQRIVKRQIEARRARITLTSGAATQLVVDTA